MAKLLLGLVLVLSCLGESPRPEPVYRMDPALIAAMEATLACIRETHARVAR